MEQKEGLTEYMDKKLDCLSRLGTIQILRNHFRGEGRSPNDYRQEWSHQLIIEK